MRRLLYVAMFFGVIFVKSTLVLAVNEGVLPTTIENSLGMKFILIPAGEFLMGSDESADVLSEAYLQYEHRRVSELGDEAPVHRVRIPQAFYLGQFEVTVGQF